jgi:hypothetical protein
LRGGQDLQLQELPAAGLVETGRGGLLLHLAGRIVEGEEESKEAGVAKGDDTPRDRFPDIRQTPPKGASR